MRLAYALVMVIGLGFTNVLYSQINTVPKFERDMVIMRTIESSNLFLPSRIFITDGYGVEHTQELRYSANGKSMTENAVVIANLLNQLMEQGFELINTNGATQGGDGAPIIGNYIFRRTK